MSLAYAISIFKIILFDLVLSGDNAVVIGLAAHRLPPRQRRQAMLWGCGMAIALRIGLTLIAVELLAIPGLRFFGAILLAWIAAKLVRDEGQHDEGHIEAAASLWKAVQTIALADLIMSLDNVLAIAAAAEGDPYRVVFGLVVSIAMLLFLASLITELMSRYSWIAYVGAAILAWTAADMMGHDLEDFFKAGRVSGYSEFPHWGVWVLRAVVVTLCMTVNWWLPKKRKAKPAVVEEQAPAEAETEAERAEQTER